MRNRVLLSCLSLCAVSASFAQLGDDGYYRVQNYKSERYIYVTDNKGDLSASSTSYDLGAIVTWKTFEKASSDPATIVYIEKVGSKYDLQAQGTGTHAIINEYVSIRKNDNGTYMCYGSKNGMVKYLCDGEQSNVPDGVLSDNGKGEWRWWNIIPVTQAEGQYFGVKPELEVGGKRYASFYASFPFAFASEGMKAYYVSKVDKGMAVMKEISAGKVPGAAPVFISCASAEPSGNKLDIQPNGVAALSGNLLKGVYFKNPMKTHYNQVAYDPATMRVLGVTSGGKLGFITADIDYLPANKAYLVVPAGTPKELMAVSEDEYATGVEEVTVDAGATAEGVYTLTGVKVSDDSSSLESLSPGIYVVGGRKVVVR